MKSIFRASGENGEDTSAREANGSDMDDEYLDCGKSVNFTYYDNLVGVQRRHRHPNVPEPQVKRNFILSKLFLYATYYGNKDCLGPPFM